MEKLLETVMVGFMWRRRPLAVAFWRQRQADPCEFWACLVSVGFPGSVVNVEQREKTEGICGVGEAGGQAGRRITKLRDVG